MFNRFGFEFFGWPNFKSVPMSSFTDPHSQSVLNPLTRINISPFTVFDYVSNRKSQSGLTFPVAVNYMRNFLNYVRDAGTRYPLWRSLGIDKHVMDGVMLNANMRFIIEDIDGYPYGEFQNQIDPRDTSEEFFKPEDITEWKNLASAVYIHDVDINREFKEVRIQDLSLEGFLNALGLPFYLSHTKKIYYKGNIVNPEDDSYELMISAWKACYSIWAEVSQVVNSYENDKKNCKLGDHPIHILSCSIGFIESKPSYDSIKFDSSSDLINKFIRFLYCIIGWMLVSDIDLRILLFINSKNIAKICMEEFKENDDNLYQKYGNIFNIARTAQKDTGATLYGYDQFGYIYRFLMRWKDVDNKNCSTMENYFAM